MFCDHIENRANCGLPAELRDALDLLPELAQLAPGRYPINGDKLIALVQEMETLVRAQGRFEHHTRYLDVQYLVSGREKIGYLPAGTQTLLLEDRLAQADIAFSSSPVAPCELILHPGMFAVFYPGELHRPCGAPETPERIRKVVLKIKLNGETG